LLSWLVALGRAGGCSHAIANVAALSSPPFMSPA
jgi:hypothetical protein